MKIRVVLTVEIPDTEARELRGSMPGTDRNVRNLVRELVWSAAKHHSDRLAEMNASITREN